MGEKVIDNPAVKRDLLYSGKASEEQLNSIADLLIERERYGEALEFLERTRDRSRLERIRKDALERGDTFLLARFEKLAGETVPAETWREIADKSVALRKYYDAWRGLSLAGDEEAAEALRQEHLPDYEPFLPEGK
jgi:hypothetical protein